jgi:hypothetical protein
LAQHPARAAAGRPPRSRGAVGPDAGPLRGIMESSARALDDRVRVSIGPITSVHIAW